MKIIEAKTFKDRLCGFMLKNNIKYGICFKKCNAIHTFFMLQPLDIIMTNKSHKIIYIFKNVQPWKIISPKKNVYYTYELPINTINNIEKNDFFNPIITAK
ncbi:MAG: DUF192 domain-containing protein [Prolixibacteraceae bacterium]|nr:DUF192 domain-containing protein [Prolixibacteraceae bacterium]